MNRWRDFRAHESLVILAGLFYFVLAGMNCGCGAKLPSPPPPGPVQQLATATAESDRDDEAARMIQRYVREPFLVDTQICIAAPTWAEGEQILIGRGNAPGSMSGHTWGYFLTARTDLDQPPTLYVFRDRFSSIERERLFRVLHEWGHVVWHYLLTAQEWNQWNTTWSREYSDLTGPEAFANTVADWCMGKRRGGGPGRLFEQIMEAIRRRGGTLQRG